MLTKKQLLAKLSEETGPVALGILHVGGAVGDKPVTANDKFPTFVADFLQVRAKQGIKFIFARIIIFFA